MARDGMGTRMKAECTLAAGGEGGPGGLAHEGKGASLQDWRTDRGRKSASADESGEYICGTDGMTQAEGQEGSERGVLVAWRAPTGHETGRVGGRSS